MTDPATWAFAAIVSLIIGFFVGLSTLVLFDKTTILFIPITFIGITIGIVCMYYGGLETQHLAQIKEEQLKQAREGLLPVITEVLNSHALQGELGKSLHQFAQDNAAHKIAELVLAVGSTSLTRAEQ